VVRDLLQSIAGYPGLLLACIGSGIVVPLPEDFPLLYAGARIGAGEWSLATVLAIGLLGVGIRDTLAWSIGRALGDAVLWRPMVRRFLGGSRLDQASDMVRRHGASAVLMGRFLVGFRAPVFVVAGASGIPLRAFLVFDGIGLVIAVPLTVVLGWMFGEPLADLVFWSLQRARIMVAVVGVAFGLWVAWRWMSPATEAHADDEAA
jgi:membrane protein DedA with SNARE-associated domain